MINIAVIDTMLDISSFTTDVTRLKIYEFDNQKYDKNNIYGHGNAVCGILFELNNDYKVNLFVVKRKDSSKKIINILEFILRSTNIKYICMSCGYIQLNENDKSDMEKICNEFLKSNRIIVAACSNDSELPTYPADFSSVIGVNYRNRTPGYFWKNRKLIDLKICWRGQMFLYDHSNSFYAPYVLDYIIQNKIEERIIRNRKYAGN